MPIVNSRIIVQQFFSRKKNSKEKGFTILELMIASTVFAVILLVVAAGVISFTNTYYKGIISSQTQSVARSIMSQVSQSIEFSPSQSFQSIDPSSANGEIGAVCTDTTLYAYDLGEQMTENNPAQAFQAYQSLLMSNITSSGSVGCDNATLKSWSITYFNSNTPLPNGIRELLNQNMRLGAFAVSQGAGNLYSIKVMVIYGDYDLLYPTVTSRSMNVDWSKESCAGGIGSQFCAVSDLTTVVDQRLN